MKLTVLGSGTAVPHPARSSPGHWLETSAGAVLLDIGPSVIFRMAQEHLDWAGLDAIWISHFHLDHIGGLAPFLFGIRHAPAIRERTKPLRIFGPAGLRDLVGKFQAANNYKLLQQTFPVEIVEIEPLEKFEILPGVEGLGIKTPHTPESLGIHLRDGGSSFFYTSDTGFDEILAVGATEADLLLMECSFVANKPKETHLELAEAMHLIRRARPKRVVLTHLYPEWDGVDLATELQRFSPGCMVELASDGLRAEF